MKIYSIWRRGGGRGRGSILLGFFPFFPGPAGHGRSRRRGAAASRSRGTGAGRGAGHIHGGLEEGTTNPQAHGGTQRSRAGAAILPTPRKAAVGDETPPASRAGGRSWAACRHRPLPPSHRCGSAGLPVPGLLRPRRARQPSPGRPTGGSDHRPGNGAAGRCDASRIYCRTAVAPDGRISPVGLNLCGAMRLERSGRVGARSCRLGRGHLGALCLGGSD